MTLKDIIAALEAADGHQASGDKLPVPHHLALSARAAALASISSGAFQ